MTSVELRQKRAQIIADARAIHEKAQADKTREGGKLTAEERANYDKAMKDQGDLKKQIEEMEADEARASELAELENEMKESRGRRTMPVDNPGQTAEERNKPVEIEYRGQKLNLADLSKRSSTVHPAFQGLSKTKDAAFRSYLANEYRTADSFASDVSSDGGYLHPPLQFVAQLIKKLDNMVFMRKYATVIPVTSSDSLGIPTLATDIADPTWTSEVATVSPDNSAQIGQRQLKPNQLTKLIQVSRKLLLTAVLNPETIVADRISYHYAVTEENAYLNGNGTGQPLGIFVASNNGVDTSRDVNVATGSDGTLTFDGFVKTKFNLKAQYRQNARWIMHRSIVEIAATLKDTLGRYLWSQSTQAGTPDTLLGFPVDESEYAPSYTPGATDTGDYLFCLYDPKWYWIADLFGMEIQRLNEVFAVNNLVGYLARKYTDGAPVLAEAFSRGKCA